MVEALLLKLREGHVTWLTSTQTLKALRTT